MAKIKSKDRVIEYSKEFKVMVVNLSHIEGLQIKQMSECMGLHPLMVSRWRKEVRDGKLSSDVTRRIQMTLKAPSNLKRTASKTKQLEAEIKKLKKENSLLKKWQGYLTEIRKNDSNS